MTEPASWSVGANFWRGDRALGGRLAIDAAVLRFTPHTFDRVTGGDTEFTVPLAEISSIATIKPGLTFPRKRVRVETTDGRAAMFLLRRHDESIERMLAAARTAGAAVTGGEQVGRPPIDTPDDSVIMTLIYSGWLHLLTVPIWAGLLLSLVRGSAGAVAVALVGLLLLSSIYWTVRGFRRSARIRDARRTTGR